MGFRCIIKVNLTYELSVITIYKALVYIYVFPPRLSLTFCIFGSVPYILEINSGLILCLPPPHLH